MTFLDALNEILREAGIIAGDDDNLTSFSQTQHENSINLGKRAVVRELNDLLSDSALPYEGGEAYITLVNGTRTYSLESDFIKFTDECPFFLEVDAATSTGVSQNFQIWEYPGGESKLRRHYLDYRDTTGKPIKFYFTENTSHEVGLWPVPDSDSDGLIFRYWYQKSTSVSVETDVIPLINEQAAESFVEGATIHFNYLRLDPLERQQLFPGGLTNDLSLQQSRAKTLKFIMKSPPVGKYGRRFG